MQNENAIAFLHAFMIIIMMLIDGKSELKFQKVVNLSYIL